METTSCHTMRASHMPASRSHRSHRPAGHTTAAIPTDGIPNQLSVHTTRHPNPTVARTIRPSVDGTSLQTEGRTSRPG
jgi:hypothetical protein